MLYLQKILSDFSLKDRYLELQFDVKHEAGDNNLIEDDNQITLVCLGLIALFIKINLTSSKGKEKQKIENSLIACLIYSLNLVDSSEDSDDLSFGFFRDFEI